MAHVPWGAALRDPDQNYFWVLHWKDREPAKFTSFEKAKQELLQELWFFSREYIDADPLFADEIMAGWTEVLEWRLRGFADIEYSVDVAGFRYYLTRLDVYKRRYGRDANL